MNSLDLSTLGSPNTPRRERSHHGVHDVDLGSKAAILLQTQGPEVHINTPIWHAIQNDKRIFQTWRKALESDPSAEPDHRDDF